MKISIAIPTYCRPSVLIRLLDSLTHQIRYPDEVLVIDASPNTETAELVKAFPIQQKTLLRYIHHEKGLTRQRNRAIQEATGDILVFFDDDVTLEPDFLVQIEDAFAANPDIAGLGGYIVNEWGRPVERMWRLRRLLGLLPGSYCEGQVLPYGVALPLSTLQPFKGLKEVSWLPGCAFAWRRSIFKTNKFSTFFDGYSLAEDKEFSIRVSRCEKLAICGDAKVYHLHVPGNRPNRFWMGYYHVRNFSYLLKTCFPHRSIWRHWQLLWYWTFEALWRLTLGPLQGRGRSTIPTGMGILRGVVTHILPLSLEKQTIDIE